MATGVEGVSVDVRLCGDFAVDVDGIVAPVPSRQVQLALAFLVLERERPVLRAALAEVVWEDRLPSTWETALRGIVSKSRQVLSFGRHGEHPAPITTVDGCYRVLPAAEVRVDVESAEGMLEQASSAERAGRPADALDLVDRAVQILGRPFLPGVESTWAEDHQRLLDRRREEAAGSVARLALGTGDLSRAIDVAHGLIDADPLHEPAHRILMRAHHRAGHSAEALRVYERCCGVLHDQLGIDPDPETVALAAAIASGSEARAPSSVATAARLGAGSLPFDVPPVGFVGRAAELATLRASWEEASTGPAVVLVGGEAGVGKSRLAAELARQLHADGARVLYGRCTEHEPLPYRPVADALGRLAGELDPDVLRALVPSTMAAALARIVPQLGERLGIDVPATSDDTERYRAFEAAVALLRALGADRPLVVEIDDIHWADDSTAALLRHLTGADLDGVLFAFTYRDDDLDEPGKQGWPALAGDLARAGARDLVLEGLGPDEVAALVAQWAGHQPSDRLVAELVEATRGNAFFILEILRDLVESGKVGTSTGLGAFSAPGGGALPRSTGSVILRRVDQLGPTALPVLRIAAVIGPDFDVSILERVDDTASTVDVLTRAIRARLVVEDHEAPGRLRFAHGLIRQALLADVTSLERAAVHGRIAEAIETLWADNPQPQLAALARHHGAALLVGGDSTKAVAHAVAAAEVATATLAHEDAVGFYELAMDAHERGAAPTDRRRLDLWLGLGQSRQRAGRLPAAAAAFKSAFVLAGRLGDHERAAAAAIGHSQCLLIAGGGSDPVAEEMLTTALHDLDDDAPAGLRARTVAQLAFDRPIGTVEGTTERRELSARAVELARSADDEPALLESLLMRRYTLVGTSAAAEREACSAEALALARRLGAADGELRALFHHAQDLALAGSLDEADDAFDRLGRLADATGQGHLTWGVLLWRSARALVRGRLEEAEQRSQEALACGGDAFGDLALRRGLAQVLSIRREQGRLDELLPVLQQGGAVRLSASSWRAARALALWEGGLHAEARAAMTEQLADPVASWPVGESLPPALTGLAEVAFHAGDAEAGATLAAALAPYEGQWVASDSFAAVVLGSARRYLGLARSAAGDLDAGTDLLRLSAAEHRERGAVLWELHDLVDLAEGLRRRARGGDRAEAAALDREVATRADELALVALGRRARASAPGDVPVAEGRARR